MKMERMELVSIRSIFYKIDCSLLPANTGNQFSLANCLPMFPPLMYLFSPSIPTCFKIFMFILFFLSAFFSILGR